MIKSQNQEICRTYGSGFSPVSERDIIGYSSIKSGLWPLNGLRHQPSKGYSGWYIWWGENLPGESDFFKPIHLNHVEFIGVNFRQYLSLEPGWRWLLAPDYVDVWFDANVAQN
ncbi:immunity protein Imm33 domain-containing protein [Brevundimonas sp. FT23028]|uniref:immunity protein Imm33 domain-containing protein n=1 Tax=Brevundimonas sp. FT23028 TaxID=3393748 RepID=UPI003B5888A2